MGEEEEGELVGCIRHVSDACVWEQTKAKVHRRAANKAPASTITVRQRLPPNRRA